MGAVEGSVVIARSPAEVADFAWRPEPGPQWVAGLTNPHDIQLRDGVVGSSFRWTYRALGLSFQGLNTIAEFQPGQRLVEEATGQVRSTWRWTFQPADSGTHVNLRIEYEPPFGMAGRLADGFLFRPLMARNLRRSLANLKRVLEAEGAAG